MATGENGRKAPFRSVGVIFMWLPGKWGWEKATSTQTLDLSSMGLLRPDRHGDGEKRQEGALPERGDDIHVASWEMGMGTGDFNPDPGPFVDGTPQTGGRSRSLRTGSEPSGSLAGKDAFKCSATLPGSQTKPADARNSSPQSTQ